MTVVIAVVVAWLAWGLEPVTVLVLVGLAVFAWEAFASVFWPFTSCPAPFCDRGKVRRPGKRKHYRRCAWCGGAGSRVRWGRRVYEAVRPAKHGRR